MLKNAISLLFNVYGRFLNTCFSLIFFSWANRASLSFRSFSSCSALNLASKNEDKNISTKAIEKNLVNKINVPSSNLLSSSSFCLCLIAFLPLLVLLFPLLLVLLSPLVVIVDDFFKQRVHNGF